MLTATPQNIGKFLEKIASEKRLVNYGKVVSEFGLPEFDGPGWESHPLSQIFGVLDQEDAIARRPFRTSVVIPKNGERPGNGYFEMLESLKDIKCKSPAQRDEAWVKELQAAYEYQWGN